jgi:hypothetical protein
MAAFSYRDHATVGIGDEIKLPDIRMGQGSKYRVECDWIKNGKEEGDHWEINSDNLEVNINVTSVGTYNITILANVNRLKTLNCIE